MATKDSETTDSDAILEHFKALSFTQQTDVLKALKTEYDRNADEQTAALRKQIAEIEALTGKRVASAPHSEREDTAQPRKKAKIIFYDPATKNVATNRGSIKGWLKKKQDAGENIEKYRVSDDNPLPPELANQ